VNRLTRDRLILHKKQYGLGNFICGHQARNQVFLCDVAESPRLHSRGGRKKGRQ
jgi:hypothetical protein